MAAAVRLSSPALRACRGAASRRRSTLKDRASLPALFLLGCGGRRATYEGVIGTESPSPRELAQKHIAGHGRSLAALPVASGLEAPVATLLGLG